MDERRLIGVVVVEDDGRRAAGKSQIAVQAGGQLGEARSGVEIELPREQTIRPDADQEQQRGEGRRAEERQPGAKGQRHGGLSVSM